MRIAHKKIPKSGSFGHILAAVPSRQLISVPHDHQFIRLVTLYHDCANLAVLQV
jgi:hypothetical protein